ncbi:MAG: sterol desaturase family protein [Bacteriovoracaceae bacterium]|nr:sterol desaturase family protein [Bacteriovoracaceae bacterium]
MNDFLNERYLTLGLVVSTAIILFIVEKIYPLRQAKEKLFPRLLSNFVMAAMTFIAANIFVRPMAMKALDLTTTSGLGVLQYLDQSPVVSAVLGFLLLDVSFYYWHRLNHKIPFLWRFHNVHHSDPDLDVSSGFRFHFGEVALSSIFRFVQVILIGPSLAIYLGYEFVFQIATFFHHSNLRIPRTFERLLRIVIVTPRMHGMHHSNYKLETDSNYSVVLSLWDRIHRTFTQDIPFENVEIGVPGYSDAVDNNISNLVASPFRKPKDYWSGRIKRTE